MKINHSLSALAISIFCSIVACSGDNEEPSGPTSIVTSTLESDVTEDTTLSGVVQVSGLRAVSAALAIEAGTLILFERNAGFLVDTGGSLACNGTERKPVAIDGVTPMRGFWEAIVFRSNDSANILSHCLITHGGAGSSLAFSGNDTASVIVDSGAKLSISKSRIGRSRGDGILFRENAENAGISVETGYLNLKGYRVRPSHSARRGRNPWGLGSAGLSMR